MKEYAAVLKSAPIFSGIAEEERDAMLICLGARTETFARGAYLLREGDRAESMGLLLAGSALIVQEDFWGNRNLVARIGPGQLFAEAFACSPGAALGVSVTADESCAVLWLNVGRVLTTCPSACARHSRMIRNLLSALADRNLRLSEKLTHMGRRTTREKLLSYLSAEAKRQGGPEFDIPFSRQQLADYLGVERSAMSAELGRLRDEGLLTFRRSHFRLRT